MSPQPDIQATTFPVAERFVSINGEGPRAGYLACFVRFVGCNLACSYCDTRWACDPDCPAEQLSIAELVALVRESACRFVTLTGGEPLLQPALPLLVQALLRETTATVEIETNGSRSLVALDSLRRAGRSRVPVTPFGSDAVAAKPLLRGEADERLAFTLDWKGPSSGMTRFMLPENHALLAPHDALKFVVGSEEDLFAALATCRKLGFDQEGRAKPRFSVFLSPVAGSMDPARIVSFMIEHGMNYARLQVQLHKIVWPGQEKGV